MKAIDVVLEIEDDVPGQPTRLHAGGRLGETGGDVLVAVERELLRHAMERCEGNQSAAARFLGISRYTLRYRLQKSRGLETVRSSGTARAAE
jgi:DNA-binding NtrC family response regulator